MCINIRTFEGKNMSFDLLKNKIIKLDVIAFYKKNKPVINYDVQLSVKAVYQTCLYSTYIHVHVFNSLQIPIGNNKTTGFYFMYTCCKYTYK